MENNISTLPKIDKVGLPTEREEETEQERDRPTWYIYIYYRNAQIRPWRGSTKVLLFIKLEYQYLSSRMWLQSDDDLDVSE